MIYVFLAEGFEETEAITPIDMLRRCGKEVLTVGVTGKVVRGAHNIPVECDITIDEAGVGGLEMIVLPGGMPGTKNLAASKSLLRSSHTAPTTRYLWALSALLPRCLAP